MAWQSQAFFRWSVSIASIVTNSRLAGIIGGGAQNPKPVQGYYTQAQFSIYITAGTKRPSVRVYGASDKNGFPAAGAVPNPEALWNKSTIIPAAPGPGFARVPAMQADNADVRQALDVVPQWLLLEFSTGALGTSVDFNVDAVFLGPVIIGYE